MEIDNYVPHSTFNFIFFVNIMLRNVYELASTAAKQHPVLAGVLVAPLTGVLRAKLSGFQVWVTQFVLWLTKVFFCEINTPSSNSCYTRISSFLTHTGGRSRKLNAQLYYRTGPRNDNQYMLRGKDTDTTDLNVWNTLTYGTKLFFHQRKPIWINHTKTNMKIWGFRWDVGNTLDFVRDVCAREHERTLLKNDGKIHIFRPDVQNLNKWGTKELVNVRPSNTLYLKSTFFQDMLDDIREFKSNKKWYEERGMSYKRGYLLHGPPGTGKTTTIRTLASTLNMSIALLDLCGSNVTARNFTLLMKDLPRNCLLVFEDIDTILPEPEVVSKGVVNCVKRTTSCKVPFSTFINAVDGINTQQGLMYFFTTNHVSRFDSAFLRRCDVQYEIGLAVSDQVAKIVHNFYRDAAAGDVDALVQCVPDHVLTIAQIEGVFKTNRKKEIQETTTQLRRLCEETVARQEKNIELQTPKKVS